MIPENEAVAYNDQCVECITYASATQIVLGFDGHVGLSGEGRPARGAVRRAAGPRGGGADDDGGPAERRRPDCEAGAGRQPEHRAGRTGDRCAGHADDVELDDLTTVDGTTTSTTSDDTTDETTTTTEETTTTTAPATTTTTTAPATTTTAP